jgi:capsular polysaccharide biosynthesis protein
VVSVVQMARSIAPEKAAKPKKIVFLAGGVLVGILLAGGMIVLSVVTNNTVVTEDAVERLIGLPVLVAVPMVGAGRRAGTLLLE